MGDLLGRKKEAHEFRRVVVIAQAHLKVGTGDWVEAKLNT